MQRPTARSTGPQPSSSYLRRWCDRAWELPGKGGRFLLMRGCEHPLTVPGSSGREGHSSLYMHWWTSIQVCNVASALIAGLAFRLQRWLEHSIVRLAPGRVQVHIPIRRAARLPKRERVTCPWEHCGYGHGIGNVQGNICREAYNRP